MRKVGVISINGLSYSFGWADDADLKGDNDFGYTDYQKQEICVSKSLCPEQVERTLTHEATHAHLSANGWGNVRKFSLEDVCEIVSNLGPGIMRDSKRMAEKMGGETNAKKR